MRNVGEYASVISVLPGAVPFSHLLTTFQHLWQTTVHRNCSFRGSHRCLKWYETGLNAYGLDGAQIQSNILYTSPAEVVQIPLPENVDCVTCINLKDLMLVNVNQMLKF